MKTEETYYEIEIKEDPENHSGLTYLLQFIGTTDDETELAEHIAEGVSDKKPSELTKEIFRAYARGWIWNTIFDSLGVDWQSIPDFELIPEHWHLKLDDIVSALDFEVKIEGQDKVIDLPEGDPEDYE